MAACGFPLWLTYVQGIPPWESLKIGWSFIVYSFILYVFGITIIENIWRDDEKEN